MNRLGTGLAVAALMLGSACGDDSGSDLDAPESPTVAPTLALLTAGQACAQVQLVNEELEGPGNWPIPTYGEFGEKTASLAKESVPAVASAHKAQSDTAIEVGGMSSSGQGGGDAVIAKAGVWAERYQILADICARTDSPIGRLP